MPPSPPPLLVPGEYATIAEAMEAAVDGDTIELSQGNYYESVDFAGKSVTLTGTDPDDPVVVAATVINGDGLPCAVSFISGETRDTILQGVTVTNALGGSGICVNNDSGPVIRKNLITGNSSNANGGGILIDGNSSPLVKANSITENKAAYGAGITVTGGSSPVIEENEFINNSVTWGRGAGIYAIRESTAEINDNIFKDHTGGDGVIHIGGANESDRAVGLINGNTLINNSTHFGVGAIKVTVHSTATIQGNVITNNTGAGDNAAGAIYVGFDSEADIVENTISENKGSRVGAIVVYRYSAASIRNNTITNNEAGTEDDTRYGVGGGIKVTYHADADISGNTITNNKAWNLNHGGGGIAVSSWGQETDVIISDNVIKDNHAYRWGGGIYVSTGSGTSIKIDSNEISGNSAEGNGHNSRGGGIYVGNILKATIHDNEISNNHAEYVGGGIYVLTLTPVVGASENEWSRDNVPAGSETNNTYSENSHGNDKCGGADAYFEENLAPVECK